MWLTKPYFQRRKTMPLSPPQQRAIALLALGQDANSVSRELDISRMTLCRWKHKPEFQQTLNKTVAENMSSLQTQVQLTAQLFIEGGLDCARQLHNMVLKPNTTDQERRLSCATMLRHTVRFWDMMGFNAKLPNAKNLLSEELPNLQSVESVGRVPFPIQPEPGDRNTRPLSEETARQSARRPASNPNTFTIGKTTRSTRTA